MLLRLVVTVVAVLVLDTQEERTGMRFMLERSASNWSATWIA